MAGKRFYKGKRTGGHVAPVVAESRIQAAVADFLDLHVADRQLIFTHIPHGGKRDPKTGGQLKRQGVRAGWPDFVIILKDGRVVFWELKTLEGTLSEPQRDFRFYLADIDAAGAVAPAYAVIRSLDEAAAALQALGVKSRHRLA